MGIDREALGLKMNEVPISGIEKLLMVVEGREKDDKK
jgi:hypothetical protein